MKSHTHRILAFLLIATICCNGCDSANEYLYEEINHEQPHDYLVEVEASQFHWKFTYPFLEGNLPGNNSLNGLLILPADSKIKLKITSKDIIHELHCDDLKISADAVRGRQNYIYLENLKAGLNYQGKCNEFCGTGNSRHLFQVRIVDKSKFKETVKSKIMESNLTSGLHGRRNGRVCED